MRSASATVVITTVSLPPVSSLHGWRSGLVLLPQCGDAAVDDRPADQQRGSKDQYKAHTVEDRQLVDLADHAALVNKLEFHANGTVSLEIADDNQELLKAVSEIATSQIDGDRHYLTAYNVET